MLVCLTVRCSSTCPVEAGSQVRHLPPEAVAGYYRGMYVTSRHRVTLASPQVWLGKPFGPGMACWVISSDAADASRHACMHSYQLLSTANCMLADAEPSLARCARCARRSVNPCMQCRLPDIRNAIKLYDLYGTRRL